MIATPNAGSATNMTKDEWIAVAAAKLAPYLEGGSHAYAESLHKTYVEDEGDDEWANDPEGAVFEDMSYWDADE